MHSRATLLVPTNREPRQIAVAVAHPFGFEVLSFKDLS
jgi:hypothetical protein